MAKNNKRKGLESANYWPGYVDALVNVVLNMLFMVGIMAVGLICLNIEALGNHKRAWQAQQLQQLNEESMLLAALGTFIAALPDAAQPPPKPKPEPKSEPLRVEAPPSEPSAKSANPTLAPLPPAPRSAPQVLRVTRVQAAATLAEEKQMIQSRMEWKESSSISSLDFDPFVFQTTSAHTAQLRQLASQPGGLWSLAVAVDGNDWAAREGFWRLSAVRQQLIAAGIPMEAISARTVPALPAGSGSSRRVFIANQR